MSRWMLKLSALAMTLLLIAGCGDDDNGNGDDDDNGDSASTAECLEAADTGESCEDMDDCPTFTCYM